MRLAAVFLALLATSASVAACHAGSTRAGEPVRATTPRVFELRTYTSPPGRLPDLERRFREHTMAIFERHGMKNIGYWIPQDSARHNNTLDYIIAHASREQARANWAAFSADTQWKRVAAESEANGRIVTKVESVFLDPTDFSPIK